MAVVPANPSFLGQAFELRFNLPRVATSVSIESYGVSASIDGSVATLNGYDAAGNLVASSSTSSVGVVDTLLVSGDISQVGLAMPQAAEFLDNLTITYKPVVAPPTMPTSKDQCKDGGWAAFGFVNQGQCVRYVETGKDSKAGKKEHDDEHGKAGKKGDDDKNNKVGKKGEDDKKGNDNQGGR